MSADKIKVLLVDDHVIVRTGVRLMFDSAGDIDVAGEAESAQDALKLIRERHFDVALVDIAMPDKNGLELLKLIKPLRPNLAVLFLSMYSEEIYAVRALKLGAAGYLTKNSPPATVIAAVRKAAAGGKYISSEVVEKVAGMIGGASIASHDTLSNRELEVLKLIVSGASLAKIADTLHLSPKTITTYRARILEKTRLTSNVELARYALENGLLI